MLDRTESLSCECAVEGCTQADGCKHSHIQMLFSSCSLTYFNNSGEWLAAWLARGAIHGLGQLLHIKTHTCTHTHTHMNIVFVTLGCFTCMQLHIRDKLQTYDSIRIWLVSHPWHTYASGHVSDVCCIHWYVKCPYVAMLKRGSYFHVLMDCVHVWGVCERSCFALLRAPVTGFTECTCIFVSICNKKQRQQSGDLGNHIL